MGALCVHLPTSVCTTMNFFGWLGACTCVSMCRCLCCCVHVRILYAWEFCMSVCAGVPLSLYLFVHASEVCMHVRMHTDDYTHKCLCKCVCVWEGVLGSANVGAHISMSACTGQWACMLLHVSVCSVCAGMRLWVSVSICTSMWSVSMCIKLYICFCIHLHTPSLCESVWVWLRVCLSPCTCLCLWIYLFLHTYVIFACSSCSSEWVCVWVLMCLPTCFFMWVFRPVPLCVDTCFCIWKCLG